MLKMMGMATKQARLSDGRRAELLADFRKNVNGIRKLTHFRHLKIDPPGLVS
jgi:hypothetical protein